MDLNHIDKIISSMLEKQLIYDKPSKKGTSDYLMEKMNDDIDNNTNKAIDEQITNIENSQKLTVKTSDNDEKFTEQWSREPTIRDLTKSRRSKMTTTE